VDDDDDAFLCNILSEGIKIIKLLKINTIIKTTTGFSL
jgi:hypothetical protein